MVARIEIFTDGACSGNPGPGGWGAVLRYKEIEKELSVICVRRKVSFNNDSEGQSQPATIYNLNEMESDASLPAWLKAVEDRKNRK